MNLPNGGEAIETYGFAYPPYTHGHERCTNCNTITARCGCPDSCKLVATVDKCIRCACTVKTPGGSKMESVK